MFYAYSTTSSTILLDRLDRSASCHGFCQHSGKQHCGHRRMGRTGDETMMNWEYDPGCPRWYYSMFWGLSSHPWTRNSFKAVLKRGSIRGRHSLLNTTQLILRSTWLTRNGWRLMTFDDVWHIFLVVFVAFFSQMNYEEYNGERSLQRCGF